MSAPVTDIDAAWRLLLAASAGRRADSLPPASGAWRVVARNGSDAKEPDGPSGAAVSAVDGLLEAVPADDARAVLVRRADGAFAAGPALSPAVRDFVELYLPMLGTGNDRPFVLAHLGQSVDASIASVAGSNDIVTGPEDFAHMHRLRALADAVLVGAGTIAADDPRLTVRLVDGPDPVRVVLDPDTRLGSDFGVFRDGASPTLRVQSARARDGNGGRESGSRAPARGRAEPFGVDVLSVASDETGLSLHALRSALHERGLGVVFIEGGGVTVTRWMEAGLLDRLHLVAAPVLLGDARPSLRLPGAMDANAASRPPCRLYQLGEDVLWDFDLRGERTDPRATRAATAFRRLV